MEFSRPLSPRPRSRLMHSGVVRRMRNGTCKLRPRRCAGLCEKTDLRLRRASGASATRRELFRERLRRSYAHVSKKKSRVSHLSVPRTGKRPAVSGGAASADVHLGGSSACSQSVLSSQFEMGLRPSDPTPPGTPRRVAFNVLSRPRRIYRLAYTRGFRTHRSGDTHTRLHRVPDGRSAGHSEGRPPTVSPGGIRQGDDERSSEFSLGPDYRSAVASRRTRRTSLYLLSPVQCVPESETGRPTVKRRRDDQRQRNQNKCPRRALSARGLKPGRRRLS